LKTITQATVDHWAANLSAGGLRRWWVLGRLSRNCDQPAAAHLLAQCLQDKAPLSTLQRAQKALRRITSQIAMDAVIDCWLESKTGETARQVIEEHGWRHSNEAQWFNFLTKRNRFDEYFVVNLVPLVNNPSVAQMLAYPERAGASKITTKSTAIALGQISAQESVDALINCWLKSDAGETAQQVIEEHGWRHSNEAQWFNFLTKRNRFDEYFVVNLAPLVNKPEMVARMLTSLGAEEASQVAVSAAAVILCQITKQDLIDSLIDCWLDGKAEEALKQVIKERGWLNLANVQWPTVLNKLDEGAGETVGKIIQQQSWRHSDEARWFLYLTATGRFNEYLAEDHEFQTLRPEFLAAPLALKARIREAVVKAGEVRMNGLFLVEKRAAELTVSDAEALVRINIRNQNWDVLIGNLWWLPARQTLDAVQAMLVANWKPDDNDHAVLLARLERLVPLLTSSAQHGLDSMPLNPVYQSWLTHGETSPLFEKGPAELKAMINDETDPPDQIAVIGALRKQDQLDSNTLSKAGLSEHWMVRWVAVHFGADLAKAIRVNDAGIEWFRRLAILRNLGNVQTVWTAKPCEVTRDGLEVLRQYIAHLPDPRAAGGLLLVEAICTHYTGHDIEIEEGGCVMVDDESFELEG
jgi:hypothetical protein